MGIGHLALGFTAKRFAPKASLGWLLVSGMFIDVLWGIAIFAGLEHARITPGHTAAIALEPLDYPYTHSLVGASIWAIVLGGCISA